MSQNRIARQPLYGRVKDRLIREISGMSPGTRIPSVRRLLSQYGVSMTTMNRALNELKSEGYLDSHWGKGLFVAERQERSGGEGTAVVDAIVFGAPSLLRSQNGFHADLMNQVSHLLGESGRSLRATMLPNNATLSAMLERMEELQPRAVIFVNLSNAAVLEVTRDRHIPAVLLLPDCYDSVPNSVLVNNRHSVREALDHLYGLGHRRIACLHGVDKAHPHYVRDLNQRLQFFYEEMGRHGLAVDPQLARYGGWNQEDGYEATRVLLDSGRPFTAMIINDHVASGVYQALLERGLRVPEDISVVGHDDLSWCEHINPPLTTIHVPREKLAAIALERCQELLADGYEQQAGVEVEPELIVRGSTGPATDSVVE